jgi:two-component system LytT family response regulator
VVDDEPLARDFVRGTVERAEGVYVVGECGDGDSAVHAIAEHAPDVVFLDIQMPELGGFDVIERVGVDQMPEVVFVTAHRQHTLRAFEVHALDYVVKPCEPQRILSALEHARARILAGDGGQLRESLRALMDAVRAREAGTSAGVPKRLTVREGERVRYVDIGEVEWLEASGGGVLVHGSGATHHVRVSLNRLLDHLGTGGFVRIHRSAAVNLAHVAEVRPWAHGDWVAVLESGRKLRVSRTHKDELLKLVH